MNKKDKEKKEVKDDEHGYFTSWSDFLGFEDKRHTVKNVRELVKDMVKYNVLNDFTEDERHQIILHRGLIHLYTPHARFLRASLEGKLREDQLKRFVDSYGEDIPDTELGLGQDQDEYDEDVKEKTTDELSQLVDEEKEEDRDVLEDTTPSYKQTLGENRSKFIDTYCQDEELMQFFVRKSIEKIWKDIFWNNEQEKSIVNDITENYNDEKSIFRQNTRKSFLREYNAVKKMRIPKGFSFPEKPKKMQLYVAWRVRRDPCFLNLSGTGAGKTLSAVIASRVIKSKMTLVICPNDVRRTWKDTIMSTYPNSAITEGLDAFHADYDESKHQYLVINYDKFSQPYTQYYINILAKTKIDFIVLDEIQFIKHRSDVEESLRRHNLGVLFTEIRAKNPNIKALGMSATPVINHLSEGISLLSYITGYDFRDDLSDASKIPNAMALHQKLTLVSIREMPRYRSRVREHFTEVYAPKPDNIRLRYRELLKSPLKIEQYLTKARLPEIIKRIDNRQTIIYTEYVTEIIDMIRDAVKAEGYTYAVFTGDEHQEEDLQRFIDKKVKVLISSKVVAVGIDGLQKSCNNLIINTLPWTHAGYKQLIGRLHRLRQQEDHVDVHIIKVTMAGFEYDRFKWLRIQFKGDLSDCAVDGRIPKGQLQSREQLQQELIKWLERLERNEISIFERRKLIIPLNPAEMIAHERIISEFTKLNRSWNISTSKTVHENIEKNPQKLLEYHNQLDIIRSRWNIDPVNVIADKINNLRIPANVIMKLVIGDFGSGRCRLADLLKENKVHCFDHDKILDKRITPCNMKHTGLKANSLGIAVFSQSLMSIDWPDYIKEAKRTLAKNGYLIVAEVTRTLKKSDEDGQGEGRLYKLKEVLEDEGFSLEDEDPRDRFTFITAMKK